MAECVNALIKLDLFLLAEARMQVTRGYLLLFVGVAGAELLAHRRCWSLTAAEAIRPGNPTRCADVQRSLQP